MVTSQLINQFLKSNEANSRNIILENIIVKAIHQKENLSDF